MLPVSEFNTSYVDIILYNTPLGRKWLIHIIYRLKKVSYNDLCMYQLFSIRRNLYLLCYSVVTIIINYYNPCSSNNNNSLQLREPSWPDLPPVSACAISQHFLHSATAAQKNTVALIVLALSKQPLISPVLSGDLDGVNAVSC